MSSETNYVCNVDAAQSGRLRELLAERGWTMDSIPYADWRARKDKVSVADAYSQGLPAWCVALGILDKDRKPCGAVIYAPRFGMGTQDLFLCSMPGDERVFFNGRLLESPEHYDVPRQLAMGSNILRFLDMKPYKGKIRSFGSTIVHSIMPAVFANQDCTINPYCYAWDVAAANAIVIKCGLRMVYFNGDEIEYDDRLLLDREQVRMPTIVGNDSCIKWLQDNLKMI